MRASSSAIFPGIIGAVFIFRPTDTWFGPDTQSGSLCYASRSFHRVRLAQVPTLPHRATIEVVVHNLSDSMLSLERMLISVQHLSLYLTEEARRIHHGEVERRDIYGEATDDEARELNEEGVEFARIPWLPRHDS